LRDARGNGSRLATIACSSAYFTSEPLKRNSKNSSVAVSPGGSSLSYRSAVVKSPLSGEGAVVRRVDVASGR
jgi:hypothetical protein